MLTMLLGFQINSLFCACHLIQVCAYESMQAGLYRLKRLGITRLTHPTGLSAAMNQLPDEAIALAAASHIERELQITPWNLSSNFVACTNQVDHAYMIYLCSLVFNKMFSFWIVYSRKGWYEKTQSNKIRKPVMYFRNYVWSFLFWYGHFCQLRNLLSGHQRCIVIAALMSLNNSELSVAFIEYKEHSFYH